MRALVYHGSNKVSVDTVDDPVIKHPRDVILKVTSTAICGSDLHLYGGLIPTTEKGDILGHEFMGEIVEVGKEVKKLKVGDRILVPFNIACGECYFCERSLFSLCDRTNPNKEMADKMFGSAPAGLYGYTHLFGGYCGGQAEYVRVVEAEANALKVPGHLSDEQVLFLTDIFPTGYMAAENCDIQKGDTVAIWGAGPVGQFAIRSALLLGAKKVIVIDREPERLKMAKLEHVTTLNFEKEEDILGHLQGLTEGRGPDSCIDAVGMEAHGSGFMDFYDKVKQAVKLESDRPAALRQILRACRKGGTVSIPGVYSGIVDKFPLGIAFNKGLTFKMGQTHVQRYLKPLLKLIEDGRIDPSFVITHRMSLDEAPKAYELFKEKEDDCIKVVLKP